MDAVFHQFSRWVGDEQMREGPIVLIDHHVVNCTEETAIWQNDRHTAKFGCDCFAHRNVVRRGCPSTLGLKSGLLAAIQVGLE